jgi:hypothetical protein
VELWRLLIVLGVNPFVSGPWGQLELMGGRGQLREVAQKAFSMFPADTVLPLPTAGHQSFEQLTGPLSQANTGGFRDKPPLGPAPQTLEGLHIPSRENLTSSVQSAPWYTLHHEAVFPSGLSLPFPDRLLKAWMLPVSPGPAQSMAYSSCWAAWFAE